MSRICDYEGSRYRTDFWESQNRTYEDGVERIALQKLLPPQGERLIEVGAGFGRLANLYQGYRQVVLVDYARTQLEEARQYLGETDHLVLVVADVYQLPFVDNLFDTLTMVRVMHHLTDVPAALTELHRIVKSGGTAVVEHASKFHLKSLFRWFLRRQDWNPFDHTPIEFVELNFNFHPVWMRQQLTAAGFTVQNTRTVSHYRLDLLKRTIPVAWLIKLDSWAQSTGNWWQLTPSLFVQAQAQKVLSPSSGGFFRCPACGSALPSDSNPRSDISDAVLTCSRCQRGWSYQNGIYDFKTPL